MFTNLFNKKFILFPQGQTFNGVVSESFLSTKRNSFITTEKSLSSICKTISSEGTMLVLPSDSMVCKRFYLPSSDPKELKNMMDHQTRMATPDNVEGLICHYIINPTDKNGYSDVLAFFPRQEQIQNSLSKLSNVSCFPGCIIPESLGLNQYLSSLNSQKSHDGTVINIYLDGKRQIFCFSYQDNLLYARATQNESRTSLAREIQQSIEVYEDHPFKPSIKEINIAGADIAGIEANEISNVFSVPVNLIHLKKDSAKEKLLAFTKITPSVNLLPIEAKQKVSKQTLNKSVLYCFTLYLAVLFAVSAEFSLVLLKKKSELKKLEAMHLKQADQFNEAEKGMRFINAAEAYLNERVYITKTLSEIFSRTPQSIFFKEIEMQSNERLKLIGYADSSAKVNEFLGSLVNVQQLKDVQLKYSIQKQIATGEVIEFQVDAVMKGTAWQ